MLLRTSLSLLLCLLYSSISATLPQTEGERQRYNVQIDIRNAYISGICAMLMDDGMVKASVVNEFGVSVMDFTYSPSKDKVKLISLFSQLDKWYIRRMLKHDLRMVMHCLNNGDSTYENKKRRIKYTFEKTS